MIYNIPRKDCAIHHVVQTGRKSGTRIHGRQLTVKRHNQFCLLSIHEDQMDHIFDWSDVSTLGCGNTIKTHKFVES